jgi:energy-coupling factor transport system permease protein
MHKLRFNSGKSLVHRLYPLTKLFWLLLASVILFFLTNGVLLFGVSIIFLLLLCGIHPPIWRVRGFRFVLSTGFVLFLLYLVFIKEGHTLLNLGPNFLKITTGGIDAGLLYSGRLYTIVFMSYIFILTTNPSQLAYAMMQIGLPYRFGFMLVTTLRLAPILEEEGRTIYQAQLVRGVQYDRGSFRKLFLLIQQFLTPLLISALRRADRLFYSMEGRGFGRYENRSFREHSHPSKLDLFCSLGLVFFFAFIFFVESGGFS